MSHYGAVLIKPDAIRDVLEEMILRDLRDEMLFKPVLRKYWSVSEEFARLIYPAWVDKPEFPSMTYNITQGFSLLIIGEGGENIYKELKRLKGKMNEGGLRLKYRTRSIEEWKTLGKSGRDLQNKIAENRIHTTDSFGDTVFLCSLALSNTDAAMLEVSAPLLANAIRRKTALQIRVAL